MMTALLWVVAILTLPSLCVVVLLATRQNARYSWLLVLVALIAVAIWYDLQQGSYGSLFLLFIVAEVVRRVLKPLFRPSDSDPSGTSRSR